MIRNKMLLLAAVLTLGLATACYAADDNKYSVSGDVLNYDLETGIGEAKGHVVITQADGKSYADYAKFNSKEKSGNLIGHVVADKQDMHMTCNEFVAHNENSFSAIGDAVLTKNGSSLYAPRVNYDKVKQYAVTEGGTAQLTDVDGSMLIAAKIDYDMAKGLANAYGGVEIHSEARKLDASSDRAIYNTKKSGGLIELIGNAKATQDGNSVAGDRLVLKNANSKTNNVAVADGNVRMRYIPEDQVGSLTKRDPKKDAKNAKVAKAETKVAQAEAKNSKSEEQKLG